MGVVITMADLRSCDVWWKPFDDGPIKLPVVDAGEVLVYEYRHAGVKTFVKFGNDCLSMDQRKGMVALCYECSTTELSDLVFQVYQSGDCALFCVGADGQCERRAICCIARRSVAPVGKTCRVRAITTYHGVGRKAYRGHARAPVVEGDFEDKPSEDQGDL